jgi:hypothetical protein
MGRLDMIAYISVRLSLNLVLQRKKMFRNVFSLIVIITAIMVAACMQSNEAPNTAEQSKTAGPSELLIESGTQAQLGDVRIGAGNIWEAEYLRTDDTRETGLSAALWISVRDDQAGGHALRVGRGSTFSAGGFVFDVIEVSDDTVRLRYRPSQ